MKAHNIRDILLLHRDRSLDGRGYFVESYSKRHFQRLEIDQDFVQDNKALSIDVGTLRGLHFQLAPDPQAKLIRVLSGAIFDVVVDLRETSPSYEKWCATTLKSDQTQMLFVPIGFAHGYVTLEPNTLVAYKVDKFYNKSVEAGIHWEDPDIGIEWPINKREIKVSHKDAHLPSLRPCGRI